MNREILPAMSEENVEIVRRIVRAFDERDTATAVEPLDPKAEFDASRSPAEDVRGRYEGLERVADFSRRWLSAWKQSRQVSRRRLTEATTSSLGLRTKETSAGTAESKSPTPLMAGLSPSEGTRSFA